MSILLAVIAFGGLVAFHEAGHMWAARRLGMRVERFSIGFGPVVLRRRRGETEYALSAIPIGGYVKIAGMAPEDEVRPDDPRSYQNKPAWARLLVILAGPASNYLLAFLIGVPILMTAVPAPDLSSTRVGQVLSHSPAARAGLESGDDIRWIGGKAVRNFDEIKTAIQSASKDHPGKPIPFVVLRSGKSRMLGITPKDGLIGIGPATRLLPPLPFAQAIGRSFTRLGEETRDSAHVLGMLLTGKAGLHDLEGPIGIGSDIASSAESGLASYFEMVWLVSVALGFLNLLPIPALDGGRGVFLLYELVSRRRVNPRLEATIHTVGLLVLVVLILFVSKGDVARLWHGR